MQSFSITRIAVTPASQRRAAALQAAFVALALGFAVLYVVGFSATEEAHNAAHDYRHGMSFPCH